MTRPSAKGKKKLVTCRHLFAHPEPPCDLTGPDLSWLIADLWDARWICLDCGAELKS